MKQSIPEFINSLTTEQLLKCRELADEAIGVKRKESKKIVWRVCADGLCYGNFRTEDYVKAAECLLETAEEIWEPEHPDEKSLCLEIVKESVPESEYESYFK